MRALSATAVSPTVTLLRSGTSSNEVYLVGTAHISESSADEVRDLVRLVKPNTVFVELCAGRAMKMRSAKRGEEEDESDAGAVKKLLEGVAGSFWVGGLVGGAMAGFYGILKMLGMR